VLSITISKTILLINQVLFPNFTNALLDIIDLSSIFDIETLIPRITDSSYVFLGWEYWRVISSWEAINLSPSKKKIYCFPTVEFFDTKESLCEKFLEINKSNYSPKAILAIMKKFDNPPTNLTDFQMTNYCYECVRHSLPPFLLVYPNRVIIDLQELCHDFPHSECFSINRHFANRINSLIDVQDIVETMKFLYSN